MAYQNARHPRRRPLARYPTRILLQMARQNARHARGRPLARFPTGTISLDDSPIFPPVPSPTFSPTLLPLDSTSYITDSDTDSGAFTAADSDLDPSKPHPRLFLRYQQPTWPRWTCKWTSHPWDWIDEKSQNLGPRRLCKGTLFDSAQQLQAHVVHDHLLTGLRADTRICPWRERQGESVCAFMTWNRREMFAHIWEHHVSKICFEGKAGCCACGV